MSDDRAHCIFDTAIGPCGVAWSARGIVALQLPERDATAIEQRLRAKSQSTNVELPPAPVQESIEEVRRYMTGIPTDFAGVALDLDGMNDFNRMIYQLLRKISWGQTTTYGELARDAGAPDAARAVGQAMGANPIPVIIPCHRVLAKGHRLGGFSAYGGTITKERLLALEGVGPDAPMLPLFPAESRWR